MIALQMMRQGADSNKINISMNTRAQAFHKIYVNFLFANPD